VLLTSGYDGNGWLAADLGREVRLLQKPYTPDQVLRHITNLLGPGGWERQRSNHARAATG
jgi:hypothetical protein